MKHILVPTDFSSNSLNALVYAIDLFQNTSCNFHILHVGTLQQSGIAGNRFVPTLGAKDLPVEQKLKTFLAQVIQHSTNKRHHFYMLQEYGNLIDRIKETIHNKKIDLIVMGTKGAAGIKETIIGSNTGDVITKVPTNLLVVPEKAKFKALKNIAFPTDYNIFYSYNILNILTELLHLSEANLRVINASSKDKLNTLQIKNKAYLQDYLEEVFEESHSFQKLKNTSVKNAIEDFAIHGKTEMIVMVAKNLNFLQQILFDSTIKKLSFHSKIPLFVLHD